MVTCVGRLRKGWSIGGSLSFDRETDRSAGISKSTDTLSAVAVVNYSLRRVTLTTGLSKGFADTEHPDGDWRFVNGDWEGTLEGQTFSQTRKAGGTGDARLFFSWNFFGAPALRRADFAGYRQQTIVGGRLQVIAPTVDYDSNRLLNLGSNRWTFIPQIRVSHNLNQ